MPPVEAWYTDRSKKCHLLTWVAFAIQAGVGQSSQRAELWAVWLVLTRESSQITICTDSWGVFCGLTLQLPQWAAQDWEISYRPLWRQTMYL